MDKNAFTLLHLGILIAVITLIGVILLLALKDKTRVPGAIVCGIGLACAVGYGTTCIVAVMHGMFDLNRVEATKVLENIQSSPIDESADYARMANDESPKNTVVLMYRFTCPDCEATYTELKSELDALSIPHYWVSSRSETGKQLVEKHGVEEVPSIIAFDSHGTASVGIVYKADAEGNPVFDNAVYDMAVMHAKS